ncbi:hypothetical protein VTK73DRAFT_8452 [Phialemonium thermophilum]|uniref:Uncharacterized protein n=1 Tax=Phialemonium thermophilum TaxID=223376 RepID=A0ABR3W8Q1_9PEZI
MDFFPVPMQYPTVDVFHRIHSCVFPTLRAKLTPQTTPVHPIDSITRRHGNAGPNLPRRHHRHHLPRRLQPPHPRPLHARLLRLPDGSRPGRRIHQAHPLRRRGARHPAPAREDPRRRRLRLRLLPGHRHRDAMAGREVGHSRHRAVFDGRDGFLELDRGGPSVMDSACVQVPGVVSPAPPTPSVCKANPNHERTRWVTRLVWGKDR